MLNQLQTTPLFKELVRRADVEHKASAIKYRGQIESAFDGLETYLSEIRRYFYQYTDHCISHSIRIIRNVSSLLACDQISLLTDEDLFFIISSSLVHDIGMVVAENEAKELLADPDFLRERTAILTHLELESPTPSKLHGVDRLLVAEYVRKRHGQRSKLVLDRNMPPCRQLTADDPIFTKWLGNIAVGHTLTFDNIADEELYPTCIQIGDANANMRFAAICLRVGDLLDISTKRVSPLLRELSEPLTALSKGHWDQYRDVHVRDLGPAKNITIGGTCPNQDAERHLREWVRWLEDECEQAVTALNTGPEQYRLRIGRIVYAVHPQADENGQPLYEFHQYRFNLDEEQVFNRLFGERLYGRPEAALRELIQNAVDATRIRVAYECRQDDEAKWRHTTSSEKREIYEARLRERADTLPIVIRHDAPSVSELGTTEQWLHISDNGIGMSRTVIERYLLKIGRSRWREDPLVRDVDIGTIGEFGIGFLSVLMIADKVVIRTRSLLPNEQGIRATVFSWKGYLATETANDLRIGTMISMRLKSGVRFQDLPRLLSGWAPFVELPLKVYWENTCRTIPVLVAGRTDPSNRHSLFRVFRSRSLVSLGERRHVQPDSAPSALCQDGLVVPDAKPPMRQTPDQLLLYRRGVRLDLRGHDRVPLDLSRNLPEGGSARLWRRMVPRIWAGIATNGLRLHNSRNALEDLVQVTFELSTGRQATIVGPGEKFRHGLIGGLETPDPLQFTDFTNKDLADTVSSNEFATFLLPGCPQSESLGLTDDFLFLETQEKDDEAEGELGAEDETTLRRCEEDQRDSLMEFQPVDLPKGRHDVTDDEGDPDEFDGEDEPDDLWDGGSGYGPGTIERIRSSAIAAYWHSRISPARVLTSRNALTHYMRHLLTTYRFIIPSPRGFSAMTKSERQDAFPVEHCCATLLSPNWLAVRNPTRSREWCAVQVSEIAVLLSDLDWAMMNATQFVALALILLWNPRKTEWKARWLRDANLGELGGRLFDSYQEDYDEEDDSDYEEDEDEDSSDEDDSKQSMEPAVRFIFSPAYSTAGIDRMGTLIPPWDHDRWCRPDWRIIGRLRDCYNEIISSKSAVSVSHIHSVVKGKSPSTIRGEVQTRLDLLVKLGLARLVRAGAGNRYCATGTEQRTSSR